MSLQDEIDQVRSDIRTDDYQISIGEWINLYESDEIDIHPEFQRFYRWSDYQKSRLIESILLGIPIPPIFVSQREDGVWDVVDGLQRLSTVFEFTGLLRDEEGEFLPPLELQATKYLPSLDGKFWDDANPQQSLTQAQRLMIKRSKFSVSIVLRESDEKAKYELFQRLNTGGTQLSDQEVRNCLLVMVNRDAYQEIRTMAGYTAFENCVALSDKAKEEQYGMELVVRFIVFRQLNKNELRQLGDLNEFLTENILKIAEDRDFDWEGERKIFQRTFDLLEQAEGENSFKKLDPDTGIFRGGFLVSAYEVISLGIGYNVFENSPSPEQVREGIKRLWSSKIYQKYSGTGVRASTRIPQNVPLGRDLFSG